jgi:uncharacterized membrane protein YvbJ
MGSTTPDQTAIIPPKLIKISEIERKSQYINRWKQNPSQLFLFSHYQTLIKPTDLQINLEAKLKPGG